jgi:hypothetical protein
MSDLFWSILLNAFLAVAAVVGPIVTANKANDARMRELAMKEGVAAYDALLEGIHETYSAAMRGVVMGGEDQIAFDSLAVKCYRIEPLLPSEASRKQLWQKIRQLASFYDIAKTRYSPQECEQRFEEFRVDLSQFVFEGLFLHTSRTTRNSVNK